MAKNSSGFLKLYIDGVEYRHGRVMPEGTVVRLASDLVDDDGNETYI